jgi:hypothetical protein
VEVSRANKASSKAEANSSREASSRANKIGKG